MKAFGFVVVALILLVQNIAVAQDASTAAEDERMMLAGGAWHAGKYVPCANGVVTSVHSRLDESPPRGHQTFDSGVVVEFKLPTAPKFLNGQPTPDARVVHYDGDHGNKLMQSEKVGDKVQVCLIAFPTTTHDPKTGAIICDPNYDSRGFEYRVYDYARHAAYRGADSQHSCGGA